MTAVDFWWDRETHAPTPPNYRALLRNLVRQRPAADAPPTIVIVGDFLRFRGSVLNKVAVRTGLVRVADLNSVPSADLLRNDLAMLRWSRFPGHTISKRHRTKLPSSKHVLNDTHLVTDKSNVQKVFAETAGYATRVDPMKHNGPAVMKRERNGSHSGRIVMLPRTLEPDRVYERLVDNLVDDDTVCDIRIPFILGVPPFAYTKFRSRVRRFVNSNDRVFIVSPSEVLSMAELDLCRRFCQAVGLDYGELDILRDRESGLIYIVDVNNTPAGPPKGLTPSDRETALRGIGLQIRRTIFGLYV